MHIGLNISCMELKPPGKNQHLSSSDRFPSKPFQENLQESDSDSFPFDRFHIRSPRKKKTQNPSFKPMEAMGSGAGPARIRLPAPAWQNATGASSNMAWRISKSDHHILSISSVPSNTLYISFFSSLDSLRLLGVLSGTHLHFSFLS